MKYNDYGCDAVKSESKFSKSCDDEPLQSEILNLKDQLYQQVGVYGELLSILNDKLNLILREEYPCDNNKKEQSVILSPLGNMLWDVNENFRLHNSKMEDILGRIQL